MVQGMSERSWDPKAFCVVPEVSGRSPHHQGPLHRCRCRRFVDVALVVDGEICKSCHTADYRLGIFKVAHHVGGGFADRWAHMVRSCSQELGLVGAPVDLRLAAFVFFTHQNCGWPLPSDFDQIRCSGISPKEALLSWHQRNVGARILSEQCSPQLHVGVGPE